jgi:hypothetical protein
MDDVLWMMRDGLLGWQGNTASLGSSSHYVLIWWFLILFYFYFYFIYFLYFYIFFSRLFTTSSGTMIHKQNGQKLLNSSNVYEWFITIPIIDVWRKIICERFTWKKKGGNSMLIFSKIVDNQTPNCLKLWKLNLKLCNFNFFQ